MSLTEFPLWLSYCFLGFLSLIVGSFLNVVIYRLPRMLKTAWQQECALLLETSPPSKPTSSPNLFFPRSFCPQCNTLIPARWNIPLLSYFLLKGKCRSCHQAISRRYPLVESLSFGLALCAAWHFGFELILVPALLFIWLSLALFFIDLEHQLLPDSLSYSLLWLGLLTNTQGSFVSLENAVLSTIFAYLFLWSVVQLFYLFTNKIGMGHGDFKLFAALAAWFGAEQLSLILLTASSMGLIGGLIYLKRQRKNKDTPIPFGPALCLAGLISLFWVPFSTFIN